MNPRTIPTAMPIALQACPDALRRGARWWFAIACVLVMGWTAANRLGAATSAVPEERTAEEIRKSLAARYPSLRELLAAEKVGETAGGYVEVRDAKFLDETVTVKKTDGKKEKITVKTLIERENADRKEAYEIVAKTQNATVELVARQNGQRKRGTLKPGEWFKLEDGRWVQMKKEEGNGR